MKEPRVVANQLRSVEDCKDIDYPVRTNGMRPKLFAPFSYFQKCEIAH